MDVIDAGVVFFSLLAVAAMVGVLVAWVSFAAGLLAPGFAAAAAVRERVRTGFEVDPA